LSQEAFDAESRILDTALDQVISFTASAQKLADAESAVSNLESSQEPQAQHRHPVIAQSAPPSGAVSRQGVAENLQAVALAQTPPDSLAHLTAADLGRCARMAGISPGRYHLLSGLDRDLFNRFLRGSRAGMNAKKLNLAQLAYLSAPRRVPVAPMPSEMEELSAGVGNLSPFVDPSGGYAQAHELRNEVITYLRDMRHIRARARVIGTNAATVAMMTSKVRVSMEQTKAGITTIEPRNIRDILGKLEFTPHEKSLIVKAPEQLVEDQTFDIMGFLSEEIAMEAFEGEEHDFLNGDGNGKPWGILAAILSNALSQVIPNSGSGGNFKADDVKALHTYLRPVFLNNLTYSMSRAAWRKIVLFRDESGGSPTSGQYLFQPGLQAGDPMQLLNRPADVMEQFPDHTVTGNVNDPLLLAGDWRNYMIVDRLSLKMQMLDQLYAEENMVGWKYRKRLDAAPIRLDAFVTLGRV
jgi:HK97 family phage major capsid protein